MVLALRADIVAKGPNGVRTIKADDFFKDLFQTALQPDEVVTEIRFPKPPVRTGSAYTKLPNKASHYAVVGCAAVVTLDTDGTCTSASVVITGASVKPTRANNVEAGLVWKKMDEAKNCHGWGQPADGPEVVFDIH